MNIDGTIGDKYQLPVKTRPFDFGTDAIERQRVSLGQSLIDADFEYGLQATKWQTYQELRRFPSFFETPGTDLTFSNIVSSGSPDANIVVYFSNAVSPPPPVGNGFPVGFETLLASRIVFVRQYLYSWSVILRTRRISSKETSSFHKC